MDGAQWIFAIASLLVVVGLFLALVVLSSRKRKAARDILDMQKSVYSTRHEYQLTTPAAFADLDLPYYDHMHAWLASQGFRFLGDLENLTLSRAMPWGRTMIRRMVSSDGVISAAIYDVRPTGMLRVLQSIGMIPRDFRTLDLASELSDGTFIVTSNTLGADTTTPPPGIVTYRYPRPTPPQELFEYHVQGIRYVMSQRPGAQSLTCATLAESLESSHRAQDLRIAQHQAIGFMNTEELDRITGGRMPDTVAAVGREIEAIKAKEAADAASKPGA